MEEDIFYNGKYLRLFYEGTEYNLIDCYKSLFRQIDRRDLETLHLAEESSSFLENYGLITKQTNKIFLLKNFIPNLENLHESISCNGLEYYILYSQKYYNNSTLAFIIEIGGNRVYQVVFDSETLETLSFQYVNSRLDLFFKFIILSQHFFRLFRADNIFIFDSNEEYVGEIHIQEQTELLLHAIFRELDPEAMKMGTYWMEDPMR